MDDSDPVANFMAMTGATEDEAIRCLAECDFDLENAVVTHQAMAQHAVPSPAAEDSSFTPSLDTESPLGMPAPPSHNVEGFGHLQEGHRPPTPPLPRALASSNNEQLKRLFARPDYVDGSDSKSFDSECEKAARQQCWIVAAVVDNSFPCECFTRDVWASDAMRSLNSGSIVCYEINITHPRGMTLAEKYHLEDSSLPQMFIVDPITQFKVKDLPIVWAENWRLDSALVVDVIMLFLTTNNPPHDPFASNDTTDRDGERLDGAGDASAPASATAPEQDVVNVDDGDSEAEMVSPPTVQRSASPGVAAAVDGATAVAETVKIVAPTPVTLDEYTLEGEHGSSADVVKLRCRLPRSAVTLQLRPETPVSTLIDYLAYRVFMEDTAQYLSVPHVSIFCGFPPRNVTSVELNGVTLAAWAGVRSGDLLNIRVNA